MNKVNSAVTSNNFKDYFTNKQQSWNVVGVEEADQGNFSKALHSFTKAIELDPKNFVSYFNRASIKMRLGDLEGAKNDFRLAEKLETQRS